MISEAIKNLDLELSYRAVIDAVRELFGHNSADWRVFIGDTGLPVCRHTTDSLESWETVVDGQYLADWLYADAEEVGGDDLDAAAVEFVHQWRYELQAGGVG